MEPLIADHEKQEKEKLDKQIKKAYKNDDQPTSTSLHKQKQQTYDSATLTFTTADERHKGEIGDFMKSIIFGGLDGIITLFAIVASISGSDLAIETVLVLGFSKLVGDGISMGMGDFISEKAEIDFIRSEREREQWEFDNNSECEIDEMIDIYKEKGISESDAELIIKTMAKYPKFFVDHMMMQELELNTLQLEDNPKKNGCITFTSFLFFGTIPLLSYIIFYAFDVDVSSVNYEFIVSIILTCLTLFTMGAVKGFYNNLNFLKSGIWVMLNGTFAAGSAYLIGWGLAEALGVEGDLHR